MPIRSLGGGVAATLAISGPAFRVNEHSLPVLLAELKPATAKISWRAGSLKRG
jgi:IclR family transcriptional regulator, acetate operon repressor